jgi:putative MATE family efflux protein
VDNVLTEIDAVRPFDVTNRLVLSIAVPMMLAYASTPLLGIVGTAVVGQFGDAALLGGLAAGATIFDVVFNTFNFLRSGTTGLTAQAFGRDDLAGEQAAFWHSFSIAVVAGVALALLSPLVAFLGGRFMNAGADVTAAMVLYIHIRMLSAPMALVNYAVLGHVLGRGQARLGLSLQIVLNGTNIALCILLGLELGWGVAGIAWATVVGETVTALAGMATILVRFRRLPPLPASRLFDGKAFLGMLSLNRDIMIRSFSLLGAFALFTRQSAQFGTDTLAANAVLMNFFLIGSFFLDGFATAAEQLAGRAVGSRYEPAFRRTVRLTMIWGFALAGAVTVFFLIFGDGLIDLIAAGDGVRVGAKAFLPWGAFTAVTGVLAFQMDGVFIGATWSRDMRNMMLLSFAIYVASLVPLSRVFGNTGLWAALHVFLVVRGLSLLSVLPARRRAVFGN